MNNVCGVEICGKDESINLLVTELKNLKEDINNVAIELYRFMSDINQTTDWKGNGKDTTIEVLKLLTQYASLLGGDSQNMLVNNFCSTSGLELKHTVGIPNIDHLEKMIRSIELFEGDFTKYEGLIGNCVYDLNML